MHFVIGIVGVTSALVFNESKADQSLAKESLRAKVGLTVGSTEYAVPVYRNEQGDHSYWVSQQLRTHICKREMDIITDDQWPVD